MQWLTTLLMIIYKSYKSLLLVKFLNLCKTRFSRILNFQHYLSEIDPFQATGLFLYPLKTLENQGFSDVFREYRKRSVACDTLRIHFL